MTQSWKRNGAGFIARTQPVGHVGGGWEREGYVGRPVLIVLLKCWNVAYWKAKKLLKNCQNSKKLPQIAKVAIEISA